ncbi:MAG: hypothetical protein HQK50_16730 [Oligoflexia bacterium]|nr:hypothetical protein [Oligoflexia bacterium]MBF0367224.1 hypothetical protein [Oligoflexia bacterium]
MKNILVKFMQESGRSSEFKLFLDMFHHLPKIKFAVIKISGKSLDDHLEKIAEDIACLNKLGIYPVIVHGAGSALDASLPSSKKVDGIRVTSKEDMQVIKKVFKKIGTALAEKIVAHGGSAILLDQVFECQQMPAYGEVGAITNTHLQSIANAIELNQTPIISPIGGEFIDSQYREYNINADSAAKELVMSINPAKLIMITETGGILNEEGTIIPFINASDLSDLKSVSGGMLLKIREIKDFLDHAKDCAVVITSAQKLLQEIFTIKGSGTYIKNFLIQSASSWQDLNLQSVRSLLENAFGKKLTPTYFEQAVVEILFEKNYEGIAVIKSIDGIAYLDKLAVSTANQGTGLGKSLWHELTARYPSFVWRATLKNPANSYYMKHAQGMIKTQNWYFYWIGLKEELIFSTAQKVINLERTMLENL